MKTKAIYIQHDDRVCKLNRVAMQRVVEGEYWAHVGVWLKGIPTSLSCGEGGTLYSVRNGYEVMRMDDVGPSEMLYWLGRK